MRRTLLVLLLALVFAPVAFAAEPAPAVETVEVPSAETTDQELADLFAGLDPLADAEQTYICMTGCTNARDCELNGEPSFCPDPGLRACDNPTGTACAGTCYCCT